MNAWKILAAASAFVWVGQVSPSVAAIQATAPLAVKINAGDEFSNVFSRTISIVVEGFDPLVRRASGSAFYKATAVSDASFTFKGHYWYDGHPASDSPAIFSDGGRTVCWGSKCGPNTDASGLMYNPLLWGTPPRKVELGEKWTTRVPLPWELGPPGKETIEVASVNRADSTVTLLREGQGDGAFLDDPKTLTLTDEGKKTEFQIYGGRAHWSGSATFRHGIVQSDALVVERPLTLKSLSKVYHGYEREYITLVSIPSGPSASVRPEGFAATPAR